MTALRHPKAGLPDVSYAYRDATGAPLMYANRYEGRGGERKYFLPYDVARSEWKAPQSRPIYNLDRIAAAPLTEPVFWVEGEKCADALTELGYLASTSFGGSKALAKTDLSPLTRRVVVIWPDLDEAGQSYADDLARRLRTVKGAVSVLLPISLPTVAACDTRGLLPTYLCKGWDVADAIDAGWGRSEIDALVNSVATALPDATASYLVTKELPAPANMPEAPKRLTKSAASHEGLELWKSPLGETYVTLQRQGHFENWATGSKTFRDYLAYQHYLNEGKAPSNAALDDRRRMLEGLAKFEGETHPVFSRIASIGRTVYLDLGGEDWKAVAITANGWQVVDHSPARFRRSPAMQALPVPEQGGSVDLLRDFLNVESEDDFRMLVAWLLGCFHPKGPYPILILSGEQGSAKSTTAQALRDLIDPASPSTRSTPNSEQDLVIAAMHNHVLSFDNLSTIRPQMADAFCRIATGGGFGTRKLHTDSEEVLFNATRPCLLNGIPDLASRPDLADRAIGIHLPVIPASRRKTLGQFHRDFERAKPLILGALLDAVSCALARIDSVSLTESPRMADFAKWVTATEAQLTWPQGAFLDAYAAIRAKADQAAIENNPVALAIPLLMDGRKHWTGTATELRQTLRERFPAITEDSQSFPRNEAVFGGALRRVQPLLRREGIRIGYSRRGKAGARIVEISKL